MRTLTFVVAVLLIGLGVGFYLGTGRESVTALIPAFVGLAMGVCAAVATTETRRKHAMHAATVLALLGFAGSVPGLIAMAKHLGGAELERPAAVYGRSATALVCLVYLVLAVRSFVQARRARESGG